MLKQPKPARLIATVHEYGDVIVCLPPGMTAREARDVITSGSASEWTAATSIWRRGPFRILVRTAAITALVVDER